ncbi:precorrin methylase [Actibacterium atlanticum]|uniref:Precorrin methylase n=1 Tax=Actibacterium atlanticum TaxID=1461693 RepID=A0A058ZJ77_9RHOB|nr:cobalamin biosynthesis protein [Actibacterium atlanticum]KCV81255.1 precorrin methylase [Actibacterium atlanticum]
MKIAGIGFRADAPVASLREALEMVGPADGLATIMPKAAADVIVTLAQELNLPLLPVTEAQIQGQNTLTQSPRIQARFGTGSLAEAAALAAAGPGARLLGPRKISTDGMATAAIAEGPET